MDHYFKRRILKILIPLWISNAVYMVSSIIFYDQGYQPTIFVKQIVGVQLINTNAWYIINATVFYILFYFYIYVGSSIHYLNIKFSKGSFLSGFSWFAAMTLFNLILLKGLII